MKERKLNCLQIFNLLNSKPPELDLDLKSYIHLLSHLIDRWQQLTATASFTMLFCCNSNFSWRTKKLAKRYLATINFGFEMKTRAAEALLELLTQFVGNSIFKKGENMLKSNSDVSGSTSLVCNAVFFCFSWNRKRISWWPKRV